MVAASHLPFLARCPRRRLRRLSTRNEEAERAWV